MQKKIAQSHSTGLGGVSKNSQIGSQRAQKATRRKTGGNDSVLSHKDYDMHVGICCAVWRY